MPLRDPGVHLEDIERYAAAAVRFTAGYSLEQYLGDEKTRAAVERALEVCGEAMRKLRDLAPGIADRIPHARDIIGFRNILAHGYAELDHRKVYAIAVIDAPQLLSAVREALKDYPDPSAE
ncbi:MAG TPA: HepT-like ribonuclease domain-containing protein [Solimonas sp.]|nr:HepT-like ribonuclease domain-containing protein [Solimonas sp.]